MERVYLSLLIAPGCVCVYVCIILTSAQNNCTINSIPEKPLSPILKKHKK